MQDPESGNRRTGGDASTSGQAARVVHVDDQIAGRQHGWKRMRRSFWEDRRALASPADRRSASAGRARCSASSMRLWESPEMLRRLPGLSGKLLACWCRHDGVPLRNGVSNAGPDNRCHGDVLVHALARFTDDELREKADGLELHSV
jgi:hypothetical protein